MEILPGVMVGWFQQSGELPKVKDFERSSDKLACTP